MATVRAAAALLLGIGFVLRTHRAWLDVDLPDETLHLLAPLRARAWVAHDPRAFLSSVRTVGALFDLVACAFVFRATAALGLRAAARLTVLALLTIAPLTVARGISGLSAPVTALALAIALDLHLRTRRRSATLALSGLAAVTPFLVRPPRMTLVTMIVEGRLPRLWGEESTLALRFERTMAAIAESIEALLRAPGFGARASAILLGASMAMLLAPKLRTRVALLRLAPLFVAVGCAVVIGAMAFTAPSESLGPAPTLAIALVVGISADRAFRATRRPVVLATALALFAFVAAIQDLGPSPEGQPIARPHRTACTRCGLATFLRPDAWLAIDAGDPEIVAAIARGRLLDHLRERGIDRLDVDERFLNPDILGSRFREAMVEGPDGRLRIVKSDAEKDLVIGIDRNAAPLREHLGDGWRRAGDWSFAVGSTSELVFVLPVSSERNPRVQLELSANVGSSPTQTVDVEVDGRKATSWTVKREPAWYDVPVDARPGRHRLRLLYRSAHVERDARDLAWWRSPRGLLVSTLRARSIRYGFVPRLPPSGPSLGDPDGDLVLASGFFAVERDVVPPGVWATAARAEIVFGVDEPSAPHRLVLEAGPPPPSDGANDQKVTVFVADKKVATLTLPPATISTHSIDVPAGVLVPGENHLRLEFERVALDEAHVGRSAYVRAISLTRNER